MEKLTEYVDGKYIRIKGTKSLYERYERDGAPLSNAIVRLAAYEETGLKPEAVEHLKLASMGKAIAEIKEFEGVPIDRLRKLAQAEKTGQLVVLQNVKYTDSDGEKALRHAMYMCGVQNNPVTRYTADAIAEKLTREAAEAALKEREAIQNVLDKQDKG